MYVPKHSEGIASSPSLLPLERRNGKDRCWSQVTQDGLLSMVAEPGNLTAPALERLIGCGPGSGSE